MKQREGFALAALREVGARLLAALLLLAAQVSVSAQTRPASTAPSTAPSTASHSPNVSITGDLAGKTVESIAIRGNRNVNNAVIANLIRTRVGAKFDPATVEEDYQRIYGLKKFANVEAKAEPTATGVAIIFVVTEQREITNILFFGNVKFPVEDLMGAVGIKVGEAIDPFRIALARQGIESLYKSKNYTFAHVTVDQDRLAQKGELVFNIVEGPNVRVRKVTFPGAHSFTEDTLKGQVHTKSYIFIFRHGTLDFDTLEDDVAALRRFYEQHGFFDARVGRKVIWSPDNTEVQVNFLIEEGPRYTVDRVSFRGNASLSESQLKSHLKLLANTYYDEELLQRDVRELVRAYSPFGFIYQPQSNDPAYLRIEPRKIFRKEGAKVEIIYDISEGRPFHVGQILVRGNTKTQDKVILREMRMAPGDLYNSGEVQDAQDRLRATPYFSRVTITPVGDDPDTRDLLVEASDRDKRTANFTIGAGVNSNGGLGANLTYEQKNFDIMNWPNDWKSLTDGTSFIGAGQLFRLSLEPGTQQSNASIRFTEPWLFDQPYSFTGEGYARTRDWNIYEETRYGGRVTLGKRFNYVYSALLTLRAEIVNIGNIEDPPIRAQEILDEEGNTGLISTTLQVRRDTTNRGILPSKGTTSTVSWESVGWLGGEWNYQKISLSHTAYFTLNQDLLDRKTILSLNTDAGFIIGDSPFFENYYAGGIGSVRGFTYRGISPRSGPDDDAIGGAFLLTGSAQVSFPIMGDSLRGVAFFDAGTCEADVKFGIIRTSIGAGIRLTLPFLGQTPIAIDVAYPLSKSDQDDTQLISFSLGFSQ